MNKGRVRGERHIKLYHWTMKSAAWIALSPNSKAVLIDVWQRNNGINNGQIVYSTREAAKALHAVSKATGARALNELVDRGFLRITRDSVFKLKSAEAREYALTMEPVNGRPATKDFMRPVHPERRRQNQNTVSPVKPNGITHETVKTATPKTPITVNGLSGGADGGQSAARGNPQDTAKNGPKTAKKPGFTVSPVKPSEGVNGITNEPLLVYQEGLGKEAMPGQANGGSPTGSRPPPRFGDQAKATRTRRLH